MEDKLVIGKWEAVFMLVNLFCLKVLTVYPSFLNTLSGTGGWLAAVCGSLLGLLITWIIAFLYRKNTDKSYPELIQSRFGSKTANVVVLLAITSLTVTFSFFTDFIVNSLSVTHFSMTPKWLICLLLLLPAIHGAYKGVGASVRITALFGIVTLIFFGVTFLSVMGDATGANLFPVFGRDYPSFLKGAFFSMTVFSDFFLLLFIMPNIEKKKDILFIWKGTALITAVIFILTVIMVQSSFMPEGYSTVSAVDRAEAYVKIGRYYARTERLFSVVWLVSYLCSFCVYFSFITELAHNLIGFDRRFVITAAGVVVFVMTLGSPTLSHTMTWLSFLWLGLPLLTALKGKEQRL